MCDQRARGWCMRLIIVCLAPHRDATLVAMHVLGLPRAPLSVCYHMVCSAHAQQREHTRCCGRRRQVNMHTHAQPCTQASAHAHANNMHAHSRTHATHGGGGGRRYHAVCEATRSVFRRYDPHFEAGSLDEAYLDVTGFCSAHGMSGAQARAARLDGCGVTLRLHVMGVCAVATR